VEHVPDRNNQPNLNSTMFMELFVFCMKSYEIPKTFVSVLQTLLIKYLNVMYLIEIQRLFRRYDHGNSVRRDW